MPSKQKLGTKKRARAQAEEEAQAGEEELGDSGSSEDGSSSGDDSFPEVTTDEEQGSDDGGEEDSEDQQEDEEDVQQINVEFEFFSPEEKDFLGLKALLSNYLDGEQFDSSGLIDAIIAESDIGSVVKTDEDDDPIAVMTALNTQQYKDASFMQQLKEWLMAKCPKAHKEQLKQAVESQGTGLIVNERLLNAHPKLGPPLVQFLMQEVEDRAQSAAPDAKHCQYKRYLLATRVYMDRHSTAAPAGGEGPSSSRPAKRSKQEQADAPAEAQLVFVRPEDEFFHQHCAWCFTFPVEGRPVTKDGLLAHRLVMQIDAGKVPAARAELDEVVGNMAAGIRPGEAGSDDADEEEDDEAAEQEAGPSTKHASKKKGGTSSMSASEVQRMAAEAFAAAAAAGAGRGATGGKKGKQKKAGVKAVTL